MRATAMLIQGPAIDTDWYCSATGDTPRRALSKLADDPKMRDERLIRLLNAGKNIVMEVRLHGDS